MKKALSLFLISLFSLTGIVAQNWSVTLRNIDGLPGYESYYNNEELYYKFASKQISPGGSLDIIRITVIETMKTEKPNGNNTIFALSELTVYDENGNKVEYTAYSNADHNSMSSTKDGDGLEALNDNNLKTYFHSTYSKNSVADYHYIDLVLKRSISTFSLEWSSRIDIIKNTPTLVGITLGTQYIPEESSGTFSLGDIATSKELDTEGQLFVLKGNAAEYFTNAKGYTTYGTGPVFYEYAESAGTDASINNLMQLIPTGDGKYIIYWPASSRFLENSGWEYNGKNGWQYSTTNIENAALVTITPTNDGYFEIRYESIYEESPITFYIGAEMRSNVGSKMKIFTPEHKNYLEMGDYEQGYSLPIAFNWSIYKANIDKETGSNMALSMKNVANILLGSTINNAIQYNGLYDNYCSNNENVVLTDKISEASLLEPKNLNEIFSKKEELLAALSAYMITILDYCNNEAETLLTREEFSSYPNYIKDTYPESSKSILEQVKSIIAEVKSNPGNYSPEQIENIYRQSQNYITLFLGTKIDKTTTNDDSDDDEEIEKELIYVYLSNGDIDAYAVSDIEKSHYTENGVLYIPFKNGELFDYTAEEYDSCTTTAPELPTMESFKFNNKYNPTLFVDAIAEEVSNEMQFKLNSIGKYLTASFTLSDKEAVAYVDTVLQKSKVTKQSFKDKVTYKVTYPGYNITKRVKVQDEIWHTPVAGTTTTKLELTADMLSTNKPSANASEGVASLLDNNPNTIFHSTWGSANNATLNVNAYITINLPEAVDKIQFYYMCRPVSGYNPQTWEIYADNGDENWVLARKFDYNSDNMPQGGVGQEYTSPTIDLGKKYSRIKILQTDGENSKNHFAIAELHIYKVVEEPGGEPEKIQDAIYETKRIPFGNSYNVRVEWLTNIPNSVPRMDIDVEGGYDITSKSNYRNADLRIIGFGIYDNFSEQVQIKGRGNSSWSMSKKPYRLKFAEKVKPFGLTKGKSWVLLANAQHGSLMANAIAMKIGQMVGAEYTNHIVPVELYMNGEYRGNYMFTEKVGMANNSIDIDEDTGYLLELDSNTDDEYQFGTTRYSLPVFIKEPDIYDSSTQNAEERRTRIEEQMNNLCNTLAQNEDISHLVDMDALARFMLANDLALNQELGHPKSIFLFKEDEKDPNAKFKFGPIWDFDWGFGYETAHTYCENGTTSSILNNKMNFEPGYEFFYDLLNDRTFKKHYYKVWTQFIESNPIDELFDYIDSYYNFAESSFQNNQYITTSPSGFSINDKERHKNWIQERMNYIYENLDKNYDITDLLYTIVGDVNNNNNVTIQDVALVTAYLNGKTDSHFSTVKADCDKDGNIELNDARHAAGIIQEGDVPSPEYWHSRETATGCFYSEEFIMEAGEIQQTTLNLLSYEGEQYKALQFDIKLPESVTLIDIRSGNSIAGHNFTFTKKENNRYRITAYSDEDRIFTTGDDIIANLILNSTGIVNEDERMIEITSALIVDEANNELRLQNHKIKFSQTTGIGTCDEILIEGGECITITLLETKEIAIYALDGRKVHDIKAGAGTTRISLPAGIYIVNGKKVVVR